MSCVEGLKASEYDIDELALDLFPKDAPALVPISIEGDGNCLPRCAAVLATGAQNAHVEMRVRMAVELAAHEQFYLDDAELNKQYAGTTISPLWSELYASHSFYFGKEELNAEGIKHIFRKEVMKCTESGAYMGTWHSAHHHPDTLS